MNKKYKKLLLSLLFDAVGLLSFSIIGIGEFSDIIWAPASAYLMTRMYKGNRGKIAGAITFIEEALPVVDVIPTFTLMWIYTYVIEKKTIKKSETIIDV